MDLFGDLPEPERSPRPAAGKRVAAGRARGRGRADGGLEARGACGGRRGGAAGRARPAPGRTPAWAPGALERLRHFRCAGRKGSRSGRGAEGSARPPRSLCAAHTCPPRGAPGRSPSEPAPGARSCPARGRCPAALRPALKALSSGTTLFPDVQVQGFVWLCFCPRAGSNQQLNPSWFEAQRRGFALCASEVAVNSGVLFLTGSQDVPRLPEVRGAGPGPRVGAATADLGVRAPGGSGSGSVGAGETSALLVLCPVHYSRSRYKTLGYML